MKDATVKSVSGFLLFTMVTGGGGAGYAATQIYVCGQQAQGEECAPQEQEPVHMLHVEVGSASGPVSTLPALLDGYTTFPAAKVVAKELPHAEEVIPQDPSTT